MTDSVAQRPDGGSHDARVDAFDEWGDVLTRWLDHRRIDVTHASGH